MMRRIARTLLSLLAPLACVGLVSVWLASYRVVHIIGVYSEKAKLQAVGSYRGTVVLFLSDVPFAAEKRYDVDFFAAPSKDLAPLEAAIFDASNLKHSF